MVISILNRLFFVASLQYLKGKFIYAFILIHLLPLFGVLFLGWTSDEVLSVFFLEILVALIFRTLEFICKPITPPKDIHDRFERKTEIILNIAGKIFYPFVILGLHMGILILPLYFLKVDYSFEFSHLLVYLSLFPEEAVYTMFIFYSIIFIIRLFIKTENTMVLYFGEGIIRFFGNILFGALILILSISQQTIIGVILLVIIRIIRDFVNRKIMKEKYLKEKEDALILEKKLSLKNNKFPNHI